MEIKRLMNSTYYKIILSQSELDELHHGLGWSSSEGVAIDDDLNRKMQNELEEFTSK